MMPAPGAQGLLDRMASGEIPAQVRLAAARGALPLPPGDLLRIQAYLALRDPEPEVREAAGATLRAAPVEETVALLEGEGFSREAAEAFAAMGDAPLGIVTSLIRIRDCPDDLMLPLAGRPEPEVIEALLRNEVRLGRSTELLEALEANTGLSPGQRSRLQEIRKHLHEEPAASPPGAEPEISEVDADLQAEMEEAILAAEEEERKARQEEDRPPVTAPEGLGQESLTAYQKVINLSPAERVKLAFQGNAEERALLIRDTNRVVCLSVLKSPRTNDGDIESYVKMRSLKEDVLRVIASNREWLRKYPIVLGLIRNPKTPAGMALTLLSRLQNRDLNILGGDRNIAEIVRQQARKTFVARTTGGRKRR
ncbi:MAG: hypothetical protein PVF68_10165 [Acidobacteriota bacterium]|jgi:hypothetical protein